MPYHRFRPGFAVLLTALSAGDAAMAAAPSVGASSAVVAQKSADIAEALTLRLGKSTLIRLPSPINRVSVGNPDVADVTLTSPSELYLLGKESGSTNVMLWQRQGGVTIIDVTVGVDAEALQQHLLRIFPAERVTVETAGDAVVLGGTVSSAMRASQIAEFAERWMRKHSVGVKAGSSAGDAPDPAKDSSASSSVQASVSMAGQSPNQLLSSRVVNLMAITEPQQVMLEVKVAEVSKTLLDKLGVSADNIPVGAFRWGIAAGSLSGVGRDVMKFAGIDPLTGRTAPSLVNLRGAARTATIDAERKDGLVKILAEPNIVAISGQEASFLAGGKIFIPVGRTDSVTGVPTITLAEREFGVGLRFTPTVLEGGRINLRVAPEVSELSQTGSPFTSVNGATAVMPSFTTRRAQTTVQLADGQTLSIAGLIKNNVTETIRRFPILGDLPVLGALFRSSEFQTDRTELMFLITPRLVKAIPAADELALPTDKFLPPSRSEFFLGGKLEGSGNPQVPPDRPAAGHATPAAPATGTGSSPTEAIETPPANYRAPVLIDGYQIK